MQEQGGVGVCGSEGCHREAVYVREMVLGLGVGCGVIVWSGSRVAWSLYWVEGVVG